MSNTVEGLAQEIVALDVAQIPELSRSSPPLSSEGIEADIEEVLRYEDDDYHDLDPEFYAEWEDLQSEWMAYLEKS
jgi:hypothetical protein